MRRREILEAEMKDVVSKVDTDEQRKLIFEVLLDIRDICNQSMPH